MAISILNNGENVALSSATSTIASFTKTSGGNRVLLVWMFSNDGTIATHSGVTWNSVSLTQRGSSLDLGSGFNRLSLWYLLEADMPASGGDIVATCSASQGEVYIVAALLENVDQTTTFRGTQTTNTGTATNSPTSGAISSATGDFVFGSVYLFHSGANITGLSSNGGTMVHESGPLQGGFNIAGVSYESGAASVTLDWTVTSSGSAAEEYGVIGESIINDDAAGGVTITVPVGSLTVTGIAPTVEVTTDVIAVPVAAIAVTGVQPQVVQTQNHIRAPPVGSLSLASAAATVVVGNVEDPQIATLVLTGAAPSAEITHNRSVGVGTLSLTGVAPDPLIATSEQPAAAALTLTGAAPSAEIDHNRAVGVVAVAITGNAPTVSVTQDGVGAGALTLTGIAPSAEIAHNRSVGGDTLALTGIAPTRLVNHIASPGAGSLSTTTTTVTLSVTVQMQAGGLTLTGIAPTTVSGGAATVTPAVGSLSLSATTPDTDIANAGVSITNPNAIAGPSNYEICDRTGFRVYRGELETEWDGTMVRPKSFEDRHPQDFVRARSRENPKGPKRPEQDDTFISTTVAPEDL